MTKKSPYLLERKAGLYLKHTTALKGRGVFCTRAIKAGEELEATPALPLTEAETENAEKTILRDYVFTIGKITKKLQQKLKIKDTEAASCVIMGVATFCNHDEQPNAEIVWEERNGTLYHVLTATKSIPKNTEICTSYGEGWFNDRPELNWPGSKNKKKPQLQLVQGGLNKKAA